MSSAATSGDALIDTFQIPVRCSTHTPLRKTRRPLHAPIVDFSSWQGALTTLLGLAVASLLAVGIRLLFLHRMQQRRERANRQINERLKILIAAYKTLGGSFTGNLEVDPRHLRELRTAQALDEKDGTAISDRRRRTRDAVEAALSDVILLGTAEQVRLAAQAAADMVAGRPVKTDALVIELRNFIRAVLDLEAIDQGVLIPRQGPVRTTGASAKSGRREGGGGSSGRGGAGGAGGASDGALVEGAARGDSKDVGGDSAFGHR